MNFIFELRMYIIGLAFLSFAIGNMSTANDGFLTFGVGLIIIAFTVAMIKYLEGEPKQDEN